jgi:hypothetical protein
VTRHFSYQKGYVSDPIRTRRGIAFKIRYRVRTADGWKHASETLYGLSGKPQGKNWINGFGRHLPRCRKTQIQRSDSL